MSDITLQNVTQAQFDAAESTLITLIQSAYPSLDLRKGTVIRDLLVRPAASVYALNTDRLAYLQGKMSLITLAADPTATPEDVNAILANFNITQYAGTMATGQIRVVVDTDRLYSLASGFAFTTIAGLTFVTNRVYIAKSGANVNAGETLLQVSSTGELFFIVQVTANTVGVEYNIAQGVSFTVGSSLYGFVSAESFTNFTGGTAAETVGAVITRLSAAISYRALDSRTSITAKLQTYMSGMGYPLYGLDVQGYGDLAQLRDKHNPMGFGVGSRVDIYPKTALGTAIDTLQKTGSRIGPNIYQLTLNRAECYGLYAIRSVSELNASLTGDQSSASIVVLGSYAFTDSRLADGLADTSHDIDPVNAVIESAGTCFQKSIVTITGVPFVDATHEFKIELYVAPHIKELQDYVDGYLTCNVEADYLIRAPFLCLVGSKIRAYYSLTNPVDIPALQQLLVSYINGCTFGAVLTRSELVALMMGSGITRVDLSSTGMLLNGNIRDASGQVHTIRGDMLDIKTIEDQYVILTRDTALFATELSRITIEAVGE